MNLLRDRQPCSSLREFLDHRMPRKLLTLCHYLRSSARLYLDTYQQRVLRPVSQGFIWQRPTPSGLLKRLWNMLVSFSLPRRVVVKGSSSMQPVFFEPSVWTVAHIRGSLPCRISGSA